MSSEHSFVTKLYPKRVPINGYDDVFARYKVTQLSISHSIKGNKKRTYLDNPEDVCKELKVPLNHFLWVLADRLGSLHKHDTLGHYLPGFHDVSKLHEIIKQYVTAYVLCEKCGAAELGFECKSKGDFGGIGLVCRACGNGTLVRVSKKECTAAMRA